jgi:surface polysaccharide O-acyltransferase-like enzyme
MECLSINPIKKFDEIGHLRGFAILAVIAIHTSANFTKIQNINLLLIINVIILSSQILSA